MDSSSSMDRRPFGSGRSMDPSLTLDERLKILYPAVNEAKTPIPRFWNGKDKLTDIVLSSESLRVQYKGNGKNHKDASSIRAVHPIPAACGIYYFEVKIISKGRDGYMGVGLSAQGVNLNRLPGWDKHSYGYHGDDGHCFCSSGTGTPYGPTFTTGDVIGCGINLVDGTCFYTKNGHHLGVAFHDLPAGLYPTVGLQTPGEIVDANFGQEPFMFDIEGEMMENKSKILRQIECFPTPGRHGDWQYVMNQMVSNYLVHHGFAQTAESFAAATDQRIAEDPASIRNRQAIRRLVLAGKMSEAIRQTEKLYPDLLSPKNGNSTANLALKFVLKVRQFIEVIAGCDHIEDGDFENQGFGGGGDLEAIPDDDVDLCEDDDEDAGGFESAEETMEDCENGNSNAVQNGRSSTNGVHKNGEKENGNATESMDVDSSSNAANNSVMSNPARFDRLIKFGQSLQLMSGRLGSDYEASKSGGMTSQVVEERYSKMLQDAFSLLAYPDPFSSPLGWQLDPKERESVASILNSAILETQLRAPGRPSMEVHLAQARHLLNVMASSQLGASAFASVEDFVRPS